MAGLIVPRGIENRVALGELSPPGGGLGSVLQVKSIRQDMMVQFIKRKLFEKSIHHREALSRLEAACKEQTLSDRVMVLDDTRQIKFMNTILQDIDTSAEDFIFYFDRLAVLIVEQWVAARTPKARRLADGWPSQGSQQRPVHGHGD